MVLPLLKNLQYTETVSDKKMKKMLDAANDLGRLGRLVRLVLILLSNKQTNKKIL